MSSIAEPIELLVSELTTNAVQAMAGQGANPAIRLRLLSDGTRLRIEVWDADPRPPAPEDPAAAGIPDLDAEGGRGLFIVTVLSDRWDWASTQQPKGKVVWCELDIERLKASPETDGAASQQRLPRRRPGLVHVQPPTINHNPDILRRLRDGLRNLDRF